MTELIKISSFINKSEIARKLNVSPQYVSMVFSNKRKASKLRAKLQHLIKTELKAA